MKTSESSQGKSKPMKLGFNVAQSYLEMARAIFADGIIEIRRSTESHASDADLTCNTGFALSAHTYIFSYMAINAFVIGHLGRIWEKPTSPLKAKYPDAKNVAELLKGKLWKLNDCVTELCWQLKLTPLQTANPQLWADLLEVVKVRRDFLIHPKPDPVEFNRIVGGVFGKDSWEFPSKVAEEVIGYFYAAQKREEPAWLRKNTEFRFEAIRVLSVNSALRRPRPGAA